MREIEIKARVADIDEIVDKLSKYGVELGDELKQHDVVFGRPGVVDASEGSVWLRIRTENDTKVIFNLKKSVVGHLDSIEHETVVEDGDELKAIIEAAGFELYSDLTKVRRKAKYQDMEICLDDVPNLGIFIEAEKLVEHDADGEKVLGELWEFFSSLGISKDSEETLGYDVLERKSRGL